MTNREALEMVRRVLNSYATNAAVGDEQFAKQLRDVLFDWSLIPQLEGIGEVLAKAWLEADSKNDRARAVVVEHLSGIGKADEAVAIEAGATPQPLGIASDAELERMQQNLAKSARALGLLDPKDKS